MTPAVWMRLVKYWLERESSELQIARAESDWENGSLQFADWSKGELRMTAAVDTGHGLVRHGGRKLSDYFVFNTDHKVIGIQYMVLSFLFFMFGGILAEGSAPNWRCPGTQFVSGSSYNQLFTHPRHDHDLPVDHPGVRRAGELRDSAATGRQRHGVSAS